MVPEGEEENNNKKSESNEDGHSHVMKDKERRENILKLSVLKLIIHPSFGAENLLIDVKIERGTGETCRVLVG